MSKQKNSDNPFNRMLQGRLTARIKPTDEEPIAPNLIEPAAIAPDAIDEDIIDIEATTIAANMLEGTEIPAIEPTEPRALPPADQPSTKPAPRLRAKSRAEIRADRKRAKAEAEAKNIPRKRGRPANGKRSDPEWIGRTFYVRKQTDIKLEDAIRKLRRASIDVDKSQLVDALLYAWAAVELGEADDLELSDILEKPKRPGY